MINYFVVGNAVVDKCHLYVNRVITISLSMNKTC